MIDLGTVKPGSTIRIPFSTFDKDDSSSITMTNYAAADILIYKDGGTTERASTAGFTATTDFDTKTGKHVAVIDLADNTTADFYASGSEYLVAIDAVTVDSVTTGGWIGRFRIGYPGATLDTTIATLASQTSFTLTAGPAEDDALNGFWCVIHDAASAVQQAYVQVLDYTGSTKTVTLVAGATFTVAAKDNFSVMYPMPLAPTVTGRTLDVSTGGEAGVDWANVGSPTTSLALTGTTIATTQKVDVETIKTQALTAAAGITFGVYVGGTGAAAIETTAQSILTDTNELQTDWVNGGRLDLIIDAILDDTGTAGVVLNAAGLATDAVNEIVDQVWDELLSGHAGVGSTGAALSAAGSAGDPWSTALPGAYGAGTAGYAIGTYLTGNSYTRLGAPAGASIAADLVTIDDFLDTEISAIKTKTDFLPSATAGSAGGLMIAGSNAATTFATLDVTGATTLGPVIITNASGIGLQIDALTYGIQCTGTLTGAKFIGAAATGFGMYITSAHTGLKIDSTAASGSGHHGVVIEANSTSAGAYGVSVASATGPVVRLSGGAVTIATDISVSGTTTLTGAVTASNASNNIVGIDVAKISGDATAADNAESFFDGTGYAGTNNVIPTVTTLTNLPAITTDWLTAAGLAADAVTEIQSGLATAAAVAALPTVAQIWTTALTEAYRATGAAGTAAQLLHEILQNITEFAITSTTKTVKKFDGSTTAKTYTLDSASAPTSITETT